MANRTLLHCDNCEVYDFAHKTFADYFVALKYVDALGCLDPQFIAMYRTADGQNGKLELTTALLHEDIGKLDHLPRSVYSFAAQIISTSPESLSRLCTIAWESTGPMAWNALNPMPYLKEQTSGDLAGLMIDIGQNKPLVSGIAWYWGELGNNSVKVVEKLRTTMKLYQNREEDSFCWNLWQSCLCFRKNLSRT